MANFSLPQPKRPRGRPRGKSAGTRDIILAAAIDEFSDSGYEGATMRAIATRAGVDSALVHHYFGSKADLFTATVDSPLRPDLAIASIIEGPRELVGERIVRHILDSWQKPGAQKHGVMLLRNAIGNPLTAPLLAQFISSEVITKIAGLLNVSDGELRASLVSSQISGLLVTRYVLKIGPIADASVDDLVRKIGPTLQRYLFED